MELWQLGLQLGVAGLLIVAGVKVALLLIANWREAEKERTKALADGFTALVGKLDSHHTADIQSHASLSTGIAELRGKIDEAINWQERTPVGEPPRPKPRARTNPEGVGVYGYGRKPREDG